MIAYKITNESMQTYKGFQWVLGQWVETSGEGELCGDGWLHTYSDPVVGAFFKPIHGGIPKNPRMFVCEVDGSHKDDHGLKQGWTRVRLVKEILMPTLTIEQRIAIGIRFALKVYKDKGFGKWAADWLSGKDRSGQAAGAAWAAAGAAGAAEAARSAVWV